LTVVHHAFKVVEKVVVVLLHKAARVVDHIAGKVADAKVPLPRAGLVGGI
jgi:hypothetical protein